MDAISKTQMWQYCARNLRVRCDSIDKNGPLDGDSDNDGNKDDDHDDEGGGR